MSRSDIVYLEDVLESIEIIFQYVKDKSEHDFSSELMLQDAVIRRFEIIGEAATKISDAFKSQHTSVKWSLMKAMRNKLIHEYFGVSAATVYATIHKDSPILKEQLKVIKNSIE